MLHLCKLAVGVADVAELRHWQQSRVGTDPPLRHLTRNFPRRAAEVVDGGSLFWIIRGAMVVRQRVLEIREDQRGDGTPCTALVLDPALVPVQARLTKAFQGWRYLPGTDAPADVGPDRPDTDDMPEALRLKLRELCLL